jgi:hypothetical protein
LGRRKNPAEQIGQAVGFGEQFLDKLRIRGIRSGLGKKDLDAYRESHGENPADHL